MARVELAGQGWSPFVDSSGNVRAAEAFTLVTLAGATVPIYAAATGTTLLTSPQKVTDGHGRFPGYCDPGTYTLTVDGVVTQVDAVSGQPGGTIYLPQSGDVTGATDSAALAAAITALSPNGGTIRLAKGGYYFSVKAELAASRNITLQGQGGRSAGSATATTLTWVASTAPFLNVKSAYGFRLVDCQIIYTHASFAGKLIDMGLGSGVAPETATTPSAFCSIERCTISGTLGTAVGATALVALTNAHTVQIRDTAFDYAVCAIRGKDVSGDFSNAVLIEGCHFANCSQAAIQSGGQGWTIMAGPGEPLASGAAGLYSQAVGEANGVTFIGGWLGDSNTSGTWIDFKGSALFVLGMYITGGAKGVNLQGSCSGCFVQGNHFEGFGAGALAKGVDIAASCTALNVTANYFKDSGATIVTAPVTTADNCPGSLIQNGQAASIENRTYQGTVASAANIALANGHPVYTVTGTTNITSITASWPGRVVTLAFAGVLTFTDGSNLKLAGNFVTTADDTITLFCDGTNWLEIARSVN